jgi:broad specificity phosphatase PhoE
VIFLCRHGQTVFNTQRRYQGQVDSPLTALGRAQASAMGRRLRTLISAKARIHASPLGRTRESASLIAAELGNPPITFDPRLMEISMGAWDGLDDIEIEAEHPGARDGLAPGEWFFHSPDGESHDAVTTRLAAALADIAVDPASVCIIVSHGVVGRVLRGLHASLPKLQSLTLPSPQDGFFALHPDGRIEEIAS